MSRDDLGRLERQAVRVGCRLVTSTALDELMRQSRANEQLELENLKLRAEVSILHWRLKSPWGRLVARWKIAVRRRAIDRGAR